MRRVVIISCVILSGLMILDSLNAGHALMMFLLAGIIPGTSIALSADVMMQFFALLIGFVLARVIGNATVQLFTHLPVRTRA
ncbi:MAG: hypothetical protein JWM52_231 [Candidatus Saccharibacteria bacterium]|nr:hypothetical protein [Candidatus Saccharibacteria bacterium]